MIKKIRKNIKALSKKKKIIYGVIALSTVIIVTIAIVIPIAIGNKNKKSNESSKNTDSQKSAPALKWLANTKNANLWKVGEEYFSTKEKALNKVGYSEVDSGYYKDDKYKESIVDIDGLKEKGSLDIPNSGTITVDGEKYLYYKNKFGGDLNTPAWFKSNESVNSPDKTPGEKIPAKVYQDENSEKYYDTEDRAINAAGFKKGTDPKSGVTKIIVDGKTYIQKIGTDAPGYNGGVSGWRNKPDIFGFENGWTIQIKGKTYHRIHYQVFPVAKGWYLNSTIVDGSKSPGATVSSWDIINEFSKIDITGIPQNFPYKYLKETIDGIPQVFEIKKGWYENLGKNNLPFKADGTEDPQNSVSRTDNFIIDYLKKEYSHNRIKSDFPYKYVGEDKPGRDKVYAVPEGFYKKSTTVNGTKDPGNVLNWNQIYKKATDLFKSDPKSWYWNGDWMDFNYFKTTYLQRTGWVSPKFDYKYVKNPIPGRNEVYEVPAGWYETSELVDGSKKLGAQSKFDDLWVLEKFRQFNQFQYVPNDIPGIDKVYLVEKGWYPKTAVINGTKLLGSNSHPHNSSVLDAISKNIPSGFKYKYVSDDEVIKSKIVYGWNTKRDGSGIHKSSREIQDWFNSVQKNNEQVIINKGTTDITSTYIVKGNPGADQYNPGSPGWYANNDKLDLSTLSNYYTNKSGANADVIFKTKQDIVKEISISNLDDDNQIEKSITINKSSLGDVVWNWRTTFDGAVLSDDNKGFYALQPQDDNGKDKFDTSKIKYKYLEEFFVDIGALEGKVKSKGWTKVTLGYKKDDSNTYAKTLADIGINSNKKLPTPTHKGQTIKIDGQVIVAKLFNS